MKFTGTLDISTKKRVETCDILLNDPARLEAVARTGLMDTPSEKAFDRLSHLAARALHVPMTIVSLVGEEKQFFKAAYGLPSPFDSAREVPIDESICRYTLLGEPIIVPDVSKDPLLKFHPTAGPWGIAAFMAVPMIDEKGHVLGAFCAIDRKVREWSEDDIHLMHELTSAVMTEIHLHTQLRELHAEREFRDRFVAALSHDLRTPLSVAKMSAELLADEADGERRTQLLEMIGRNMDRGDKMIQDLLDASRIHGGEKIPLKVEPTALGEVVRRTLYELESLHGPRLVLDGGAAEVAGQWDAIAIQRMIENLIGNAVKYGRAGTPITVKIKFDGRDARISVHNLGDPIPAAKLKNLFEVFHRGDSDQAKGATGWGIGLTLVKGLAEAHGGGIEMQSSYADGTTFTIRLPGVTGN